jgi:hypothetical protein
MPMNRKLLGAAAFSLALAGGGAAGAILGTPNLTLAQYSGSESTTDSADVEHYGPRGAGLDAAAEAIGITSEELRTAVRDGSTIAEVAEANDVDVQTVIDKLVADAETRLDEAVANGRLTEDQAAEIKANLPDRVTAMVNGEGPFGGPDGPPPADDTEGSAAAA